MLGIKIKYSDNNEGSVRPAVVSTEKRTDQWSVLLVSVGENRDRKAFAQLFAHFAPLLKSFAEASRHEGWFPGFKRGFGSGGNDQSLAESCRLQTRKGVRHNLDIYRRSKLSD